MTPSLSESTTSTLFLLGATGYVGGQILVHLARELPTIQVIALVRNANDELKAALHKLNPNVSVAAYTGSYETAWDVIKENTEKADIIVHAGDGDVEASLQPILAGLEESAKRRRDAGSRPPTYIHISGYGLISDNSWGQPINPTTAKKYIDTQFDIKELPETNMHYKSDRAVIEFGDREDLRVNTNVIYFGWIYGVGEGLQKTSSPLRFYIQMAKEADHSVTFGPGLNYIANTNIKDAASCIVTLVKAGIEGTGGSGTNGIYFAASDVLTSPRAKDISDGIGNVLHEFGQVSQPGSQPIPEEMLKKIPEVIGGAISGSAYGIPQRLKQRFGVELTETERHTFLESLAEEVKVALGN
ncbi:hypothetical protein AX16_003229 [Volvariella volvacea WC 439]|nr:hypothetical protein AX16_003229 [Volvariella volvacea WC 439]